MQGRVRETAERCGRVNEGNQNKSEQESVGGGMLLE